MGAEVGWIGWLVIGGLAGWIGSKIMGTDAQQGIVLNVIVGIVGAVIGGLLLGLSGHGRFGVDHELRHRCDWRVPAAVRGQGRDRPQQPGLTGVLGPRPIR